MYKEWQIPFFLNCALNERDQFLHSPIYGFHGADFMIKLHIRGKERHMHMGLVRTIPSSGSENAHNCNSSIHLHYKIGIKKLEGPEFKCWSEEWTFPYNGCTGRLWECINLSEIMSEKGLFGPNGALTLFCSFSTEEFETSKVTLDNAQSVNRPSKLSFESIKSMAERICQFAASQAKAKETSMKRVAKETSMKRTETQHPGNPGSYFKRRRQDFEKLSQNYGELLVTGRDNDVTIKVEDREFLAHKLILCTRSPVFDKMFKHDMQEKRQSIVEIKDCTPDAFKEFLRYLYCGELEEFTRNTVFELYFLSDKYDVQELKSASMEFIAEDLCMDTFCDVLVLAMQHNDSILLKKALKFFTENIHQVIKSVKWLSFRNKNPIQAKEFYMKALFPDK